MQIFAGQVRFGIHAGPQNVSYEDYRKLWLSAEELGLDWASVFDHFMPIAGAPIEGPCFEGMTLLSAMAAETSRIRCGILVVGNTYRNPAVLANMAATIDHVSGGRLELGIGAGWYEAEHSQYNIPFHTAGRRIRMLGESAKILRNLLTADRTTFNGRYYTVHDALCEPKPLQERLPIWVGGSGEQLTLRVVAESADGWNTFLIAEDAYRHKLDVLAAHCRDVGREPGAIRKSLVFQAVLGESEEEARELASGLPADPQRAVGTPEQLVSRLLPYIRLGVGDFILGARPPLSKAGARTMELLAKQVAPVLRQEGNVILAGLS